MTLPRDLKGYGEEGEGWQTLASAVFLLVLFSLMGWCTVDKYSTQPPVPALTKEQIRDLTAEQLAIQTMQINAEMERRSR